MSYLNGLAFCWFPSITYLTAFHILSPSARLYIFAFFNLFPFFFFLPPHYLSKLSVLSHLYLNFFHLLFSLDSVKPLGFTPPSLSEISMAHSAVPPLPVSSCLSQLLSQQICFLFGPVRSGHLLTGAIPSYTNCIRNTYRKGNIKCNEMFDPEEYRIMTWCCLSLFECSHTSGVEFLSSAESGWSEEREGQRQRQAHEIQSLLSLQQISFIRLVAC